MPHNVLHIHKRLFFLFRHSRNLDDTTEDSSPDSSSDEDETEAANNNDDVNNEKKEETAEERKRSHLRTITSLNEARAKGNISQKVFKQLYRALMSAEEDRG